MTEEPARPASTLVGQALGGRYDVTRLIGRGSMGDVYQANHRLLSKRVAVKVLGPALAADDYQRRRFLRAARAASLIEHANVVSILDFGDDDPTYFVMELLDGEDLRALLEREGGLRWTRARAIILQITAALAAAHAQEIVHRDVKPSNCMLVRRDGNPEFVTMLDFGIAKLAPPSTDSQLLSRTHALSGTVEYMAPEQAFGDEFDARTDVYALGVVMYEMLTGKVPFFGGNTYQILDQHVRKPVPPPRFVDAAIPHPVSDVLMRALAKNPDDRFQSMAELAEAVTGVVAKAPTRTVSGQGTEFLPSSDAGRREMPPTEVLVAPVRNVAGPTEVLVAPAGAVVGGMTQPALVRPPELVAARAGVLVEVTPVGGMRPKREDDDASAESRRDGARPTETLQIPDRSRSIRVALLVTALVVAVGGGVVLGSVLTDAPVQEAAPVKRESTERAKAEPEIASPPEPARPSGPVLLPVSPPIGADGAIDAVAPVAEPAAEPAAEPEAKSEVALPSDPPTLPSSTVVEPAPQVAKSSPRAGGARPFETVASGLRKKARALCKDGVRDGLVEVSFHVSVDGSPTLVKAVGSNESSAGGACVAGIVKAARFSRMDVGRHSLVVQY